ncbi:MAG TPA: hypothetical protein VF518_01280, partial [Polyangia bacterium]
MTFPSCDLVALLAMPSGEIVDSVYIRSAGAVSAGTEPTCPTDCDPGEESATDSDSGAPSDGGAGDGQAAPSENLGVGAMALLPDSSRLYVGASAADTFITALDIVDGVFSIPAGGGKIALEPGAIGVDHMRFSIDPWKPVSLPDGTIDPTRQGGFLDGLGHFLYAFARDGSVRVVNVGSIPPQECDVNARPELATSPISPGCYPVNPKARNPLARGPGIRIPALPVRTAPPPIPRDIAVVDLPPVSAADISKNPQSLSGQFAFLLASNDSIYILNLAPKTLDNGGLADEKALTHSFRETRATGQYAADMLVLSSTPPLRTPLPSDLLFPTTPVLAALDGPRLESVTDPTPPQIPISTNYSTASYWADFPYPSTYVSRVFTIAWEDMLPGTARSSGVLHDALNAGTSAGALEDAGGDFCARDVTVGDLVMLPGCTLDTDCSPQDRFSCRQPVSGATGLCLPKDASATLLEQCARFSGSRRRYEVLSATSTRLGLGLHLDEVPKTALNRPAATEDTGARDGECQPTDSHKLSGFAWKQVWPNEPYKRCVQVCGTKLKAGEPASAADQDCRPGFVCADVPGSMAPSTFCVEAPPLTPSDLVCWPQPGNRYHV